MYTMMVALAPLGMLAASYTAARSGRARLLGSLVLERLRRMLPTPPAMPGSVSPSRLLQWLAVYIIGLSFTVSTFLYAYAFVVRGETSLTGSLGTLLAGSLIGAFALLGVHLGSLTALLQPPSAASSPPPAQAPARTPPPAQAGSLPPDTFTWTPGVPIH